jgi:hypothetical protein
MLNKQTHQQHKKLMKYTSDWLPTGKMVHHNDPMEEHRRPHCFTVYETNAHLLRCPQADRRAMREKFLSVTMNNFYHTSNMAQPLRALISQNLIQWFQNPARTHRTPRTNPLHRAAQRQERIGWQHFLRGRIAQTIIDYQEKYYRDRERPDTDTGHSWAKK